MLEFPPKRFDRALVTSLTDDEVSALPAVPDRRTWTGRRDRALLLVAIQTGLRTSELIGLTCNDVHLGTSVHVRCHGQGRKARITPLTAASVAALRIWITERTGEPATPLFPTRRGRKLGRDARGGPG
ncbi:MAG: tyrosine-type recombinase/integrase [Firmicutes bacterium]|nr:tyrosine-type recombinase/integrase [Bacillota bacterium]